MEKQRPKHEGQIGFRLPRELRARLNLIHERHLTSDAGVFRALAEAFCDEAEKQQRVVLPLRVQFSEEKDSAERWALNEAPGSGAASPNGPKGSRAASKKKAP